jgi:DNA-directed RNA polymerase subunit RPC12/RpoP
MGKFTPNPSFGAGSDEAFIKNALFVCHDCGKECRLKKGRLISEDDQRLALGDCSECGKPQRFDVTNARREEDEE